MKHLEELALREIRVFDHWTDAPLGTLLQMTDDNIRVIGVRSRFGFNNGLKDGIAIVSGDRAGNFLFDGLMGPALDLTDVVEVVAKNLGPSEFPRQVPAGLLVRHDGMHYLWVKVLPNGDVTGYVCLETGEYKSALPSEGRVAIGASVGVRMKLKADS